MIVRIISPRGMGLASSLVLMVALPGCSNPFGSATDTPSNGLQIGPVALPPLLGSGVSRAALVSTPSVKNFGIVSTSPHQPQSQVFSLGNAGEDSATQVIATVTGPGFSLTNNHCGSIATPGSLTPIANGGTPCSLEVTFAPTSGSGSTSGSLTISYHDGSTAQSLTIGLTGEINHPPELTEPASRVFPISTLPGPVPQGELASFTPSLSDTEGDTVNVTCTVESVGLSATDPNTLSPSTPCTNLASLIQVAGALTLGQVQFNSSTGVLAWWPTKNQRGTFRFTLTPSDAYGAGGAKTFLVSVRENFPITNLAMALDASLSDGTAPRLDGTARDNLSAWLDLWSGLTANLSGFFTSVNPWKGDGGSINFYSLDFAGDPADRLSLGTTISSATKFAFSTWLKSAAPNIPSSVILSNGGGSNSGFVVRQTTVAHLEEAGKIEFQVGKGNYESLILRDHPLSYWRLGENAATTVATDLGPSGFHLNYSASLTKEVSGALHSDGNTAVTFSGQNDEEISTSAALPAAFVTQTYSYELWFKTPSVPAGQDMLIMVGSYNTGNQYIQLSPTPGGAGVRVEFMSYGSSGWIANSAGGAVSLNEWHHVVATRDPVENKMRLYVDGVPYANVGMPIPSIASYGTGNIAMAIGGASRWHLYNHVGQIDEVAVYGYPLSAQQALNHFNAGKYLHFPMNNILSRGPKHFFKLNETSGALAYDIALSGGVTGIYNSTATYSSNVILGSGSSHPDHADFSVELPGANSFVSGIGTPTMMRLFENGGKFTLALWAKVSDPQLDPGYEPVLLGTQTSGSGKGMQIRYQPLNHRYVAQLHNGTSSFGEVSTGNNSVNDSHWHHLAYVGDGAQVAFYLDGVLTQSLAISAFGTGASSAALALGALPSGSQGFQGQLDDFAIWNHALPASDISSLVSSTSYLGCQSSSSLGGSTPTWHHLAGHWDGTLLQVFVDGRLECAVNPQLSAGATYSTPSSNLFIGATANGSSAWTGALADFRLYGSADGSAVTTVDQIKSDYDATANRFRIANVGEVVTDHVLAWYDPGNAKGGINAYDPGCEAAQRRFFDLSKYAHDLNLNNFSSIDCNAGVSGWQGSGTTLDPYRLSFDGTDDRLELKNFTFPVQGSVDLWVNPTLGSDMTLFSMGSAQKLIARITSDGHLQFSQGAVSVLSTVTVADETWVNLNFIFNGNEIAIYKNGALTADAALSFNRGGVSGNLVVGGQADGLLPLNASLGHIIFYDVNLSPAEVKQNCSMVSPRFGVACQ